MVARPSNTRTLHHSPDQARGQRPGRTCPERGVFSSPRSRPRLRTTSGLVGAGLCLLGTPGPARATPQAPRIACAEYPGSPLCTGRLLACDTCHTSTDPPAWNAFGASIITSLKGAPLAEGLAEGLRQLEDDDSDSDGVSNLDELRWGTNPGDPASVWIDPPVPDGPNPYYDLGHLDLEFAYRRAMVVFCGRSPSYADLAELRTLEPDAAREHLHRDLDECLDSDSWTKEGLSAIADPLIKPIQPVGADTDVVIAGFRVVLGDYDWDYRLWRYLLTDDRDVRELLTADYHVIESSDGQLEKIEGPVPDPVELDQLAGGQPLEPEYRAGMLTTQWFLMSNTMFSALPRTTAAQAYRAYLGMDLSAGEGVWPVEGEPLDIDDKGVAQSTCAQCHSTLDPLAYAFSYYDGIVIPTGNGRYRPDRPGRLMDRWPDQDPTTYVLGQEVNSVVEWGEAAAQTPAFRMNMTTLLFEHALGRSPLPDEHDEVLQLADSMVQDGHSANRLIHRLVETHAFASP